MTTDEIKSPAPPETTGRDLENLHEPADPPAVDSAFRLLGRASTPPDLNFAMRHKDPTPSKGTLGFC